MAAHKLASPVLEIRIYYISVSVIRNQLNESSPTVLPRCKLHASLLKDICSGLSSKIRFRKQPEL